LAQFCPEPKGGLESTQRGVMAIEEANVVGRALLVATTGAFAQA
jgi:hypothetical protein